MRRREGTEGRDELTRGQRWDLYLGGVLRRYFLAMIGLAFIAAVLGALNAVWPPLAWIALGISVVGAAVVLVGRVG